MACRARCVRGSAPGRGSSSHCRTRPSGATPLPSPAGAGCRPASRPTATPTPPDLKESFAVGSDQPTGDPGVDGYWFQPNVYPAEAPALEPAVVAYLARMRGLADELLVVCATALALDGDFFTRH